MNHTKNIDRARVSEALEGRLDPTELSSEENAVRVEAFIKLMGRLGKKERVFFAQRRRLGLGVGLDDDGTWSMARAILSLEVRNSYPPADH